MEQMSRIDERRQGTARLISLHDRNDAFDREFWKSIPEQKRFEMVWDLTLEWLSWRGDDGVEQRLQRSVLRIERSR